MRSWGRPTARASCRWTQPRCPTSRSRSETPRATTSQLFRPGRARCVDRAATLRSSSKDTSCGERATAPKFALSVERRREGGELGHLAASCVSLCLSPMKPGCLHLREKLRLVVVVVVVASVRCSASGHKGVGVGSLHVAISWQTVTDWLAQGQRHARTDPRPPSALKRFLQSGISHSYLHCASHNTGHGTGAHWH